MADGKFTRRKFLKAAGVTAVGLPIVFALNESFAVELTAWSDRRRSQSLLSEQFSSGCQLLGGWVGQALLTPLRKGNEKFPLN